MGLFRGSAPRRVTAGCLQGNEASWRLMERAGMRRETHTIRESLHRSGDWLGRLLGTLSSKSGKPRKPTGRRGCPTAPRRRHSQHPEHQHATGTNGIRKSREDDAAIRRRQSLFA